MAQLNAIIDKKIKAALASVAGFARVDKAFLFGSQIEGTADQWSDIDLAIFTEDVETWDIHKRARFMAQVQKESGDDVEVHFISSKALLENDKAGFASWVISHGIELTS
jgi:predicted nucleotidyltransferase